MVREGLVKAPIYLCFSVFLALGWTLAARASEPGPGQPFETKGEIRFQGRIVRVELEGGFWGLVAEDGSRYEPDLLPPEFRQDGMRVRVTARELEGTVSFRMWGRLIRILDITFLSR